MIKKQNMHLFYTPDINGETYVLNEEESRHCIKVLRLSLGDIVYLTDGRGNMHKAKLSGENPKRCEISIIETQKQFEQRDYYLHIAIAPTKNIDRLEWFLEKATEIGIDEITPLSCERSERTIIKTERLNKIIVSAVKQSLKAYHPVLNNLTKFNDFIKQPFNGRKLIAHCEIMEKNLLQHELKAKENVLILIGPEGDFSLREIGISQSHNFTPISLGKSRLRTETAALVACSGVNFVNS